MQRELSLLSGLARLPNAVRSVRGRFETKKKGAWCKPHSKIHLSAPKSRNTPDRALTSRNQDQRSRNCSKLFGKVRTVSQWGTIVSVQWHRLYVSPRSSLMKSRALLGATYCGWSVINSSREVNTRIQVAVMSARTFSGVPKRRYSYHIISRFSLCRIQQNTPTRTKFSEGNRETFDSTQGKKLLTLRLKCWP